MEWGVRDRRGAILLWACCLCFVAGCWASATVYDRLKLLCRLSRWLSSCCYSSRMAPHSPLLPYAWRKARGIEKVIWVAATWPRKSSGEETQGGHRKTNSGRWMSMGFTGADDSHPSSWREGGDGGGSAQGSSSAGRGGSSRGWTWVGGGHDSVRRGGRPWCRWSDWCCCWRS